MNPTAIYSKSGKGVQEASGKTSHLSRPDRTVLSAIDGRVTLADVAQKVGKAFDPAFAKLIVQLDKDGFIREVSPGAAAPKPAAGAKPAGKSAATAPMDAVSDLDFTASMSAKPSRPQPPPQAPPRAAPPPPKATVTIPPPPPPPSAADKAKAERIAKEQQDAFTKAREEAERKAQEERDRLKAEAESKMRAETEARLRAETEAKLRAEVEAKAAAEAKAKAEAEAKRAREEAERVRREVEEKAQREQEELKRRLEEERKAREEAERKAKEEARRLEEERKKLEEERKRREEEQRREEEERERAEKEARRKAKEKEEQEREAEKAAKKEAERAERRKREQEEEERERAEKEARRREQEQEEEKPEAKAKEKETEAAAAKPAGGGFADSLLADLESFTTRDEEEAKAKAEAERKAKEEAAQRAREAEERRAKEDAEREKREAKERRRREEDERKAKEEAERKEHEEKEQARLREEEEKREREAEERERKAKKEDALEAKATRAGGDTPFSDEAALRAKREREMAAKPKPAAAKARGPKKSWRKPIAIGLGLVLVVVLGVVHVMPIDTADYERAASEALGRPVKISSAKLSLLTGLEVRFAGVSVGDGAKIATVRGHPDFGALLGPKKNFSRIELEGVKLEQQALGEALFAKVKGDNFSVRQIIARQLELQGPLVMPKGLEADLVLDAEGAVRSGTLRGPEALVVKLEPKGSAVGVDMSAASFALPFAPEISLSKFSMKATATRQGLSVAEWDGAILNGTLSGTANVRWGDTWIVDGVVTARGINAAVFAPALLSDGKAEGSGKFLMRGPEPAKLAASGRLEGSFTVGRGVLGSFDLSRAIQTAGRETTGRTPFAEMNGQAVYDRGAVALRNVTIGAGALNAGASADIAQSGALSGRIVADVRTSSQTLRATLNLGGTVKEPRVRN